jgi:hypothetical protein
MELKQFIKSKLYESFNKQTNLNEYFTNDIIYLKDYFKMPKSTKMAYLPHEYHYFFEDFLIEDDVEFELPKNEYIDNDGNTIYSEEYDTIELMTWLENNNKEIYNQFAEYLYNKISNNTLPINDAEYPAWSYFDDNPQIIKNQWLIHFTNDAYGIAENGFKYGVDDMTKLGLTTHLGDFDKKYGGYNFAYTLNDFQKYASSSYSGYKYGKEAVIFNASGIKVWHYGDEEPQVIFYGNTAKNIIPITNGENAKYGIYNKNGNLLYENDDLPKIVNWIVNNYQQYRKNFSK